MNELIFLAIFLICLISLIVTYNTNKKENLINLSILLLITSFIMCFKNISLLGTSIISSVIPSTFLALILFIFTEKNKPKDVESLLKQHFISLIITTILMMILVGYIPSVNDSTSINIQIAFRDNYRILFIFPLTFLTSEYLSLIFYRQLKTLYNDLFITLGFTTLVVGIIETFIFCLIGYFNTISLIELFKLVLSTYLTKLVLTLICVPLLKELLTKKKVKRWILFSLYVK